MTGYRLTLRILVEYIQLTRHVRFFDQSDQRCDDGFGDVRLVRPRQLRAGGLQFVFLQFLLL